MAHLSQEGENSPDPLFDHPSAPHTGKRKSKYVKDTTKDITIYFGLGIAMEVVAKMASTILVGHVHDRAYSADRLIL